MATQATAIKKVRLACQRCRVRRIKCDGQNPACTNCAKAGATCLDVDSQNSDVLIPRNFSASARARIRWLEEIIADRAPDVDLRAGPQVEPSPSSDARSPADEGAQVSRDHAGPYVPTSSRKRPADPAENGVDDDSFPEHAHSVAVNLGMLSLNSDSTQKHYLGSSSGLLFTSLIGTPPASTESPPGRIAEDADAGNVEWSEEAAPHFQELDRQTGLCVLLRQELPSKQDALVLAHTYVHWIHSDHPVLDPTSIFNALDAIYACVSVPTDGHVEFSNGWPTSVQPFLWNGRLVGPGAPHEDGASMPLIAFILLLVFNIGAIVKVRSHVYDYPPKPYYLAATQLSKDAFGHSSLSSLQALVMLAIHAMLTPAEVNLWTLTHLALSTCIEIGVHRRKEESSVDDFTYEQVRRFAFSTVYSLDRSISSIQGRPLGFRDETFDQELPRPPPYESSTSRGTIPPAFDSAVTNYANYVFKLDRIVSNIKLLFYHLPVRSVGFSWPAQPKEQQKQIGDRLQQWWKSVTTDSFDYPALQPRQLQLWKSKLKIKLHTALILLYQPSQVIRSPSSEALSICFDSASRILNEYQALHDTQSLHYGWRAVQNIFAAGATLVYSFWASESVRRTVSTANMARDLRICSSLLTVGSGWWPSVKTGNSSFGAVADLTMRKLHSTSVKLSRLSAGPSSPGTGRSKSLHQPIATSDALPGSGTLDSRDYVQFPYDSDSWPEVGSMPSHEAGPELWQSLNLGNAQDVGLCPEIETFLTEFERSDQTWAFPL